MFTTLDKTVETGSDHQQVDCNNSASPILPPSSPPNQCCSALKSVMRDTREPINTLERGKERYYHCSNCMVYLIQENCGICLSHLGLYRVVIRE